MMFDFLIPVLYVAEKSHYYSLPVSCFDKTRDALTFKGFHSFVAHPPCRLFSRLRKFSTAPISEVVHGIMSIIWVQWYGGIVEHPAKSLLWRIMKLPMPGASYDQFGGFTIQVQQSDFGAKYTKKTWLYIVGCSKSELPPIPIRYEPVKYSVSCSKRKWKSRPQLREVSKWERSVTSLKFDIWLIEVARICEVRSKLNLKLGDKI